MRFDLLRPANVQGRHAVELRAGLPVGVYLVRLTQAGRALARKAVILR